MFGFCITHILNTGCAKIWKKKSVAKRLSCYGARENEVQYKTVFIAITDTEKNLAGVAANLQVDISIFLLDRNQQYIEEV